MPLWEAALLGVVQGLTEFLPISSTAHLLLAQELLGRSRDELQNSPFTVVIQLGTLAAVFVYFRADVAALVRAVARDLLAGRVLTSDTVDGRLARLILVGTVPGGLAGLLFKTRLKETFYNAPAIAWVAIVFALLMAAAEWWAARRRRARPDRTEADVGWADAVWVGVFQALALMPGGSRSGATITAGLFAGLSRPAAARFSFLLSLPIMLAAGLKELVDEGKKLKSPDGPHGLFASGDELAALAVGTATSAVVGYLATYGLLAFLRRYSTGVFVVYRLLLGAGILGLIAAGVLDGR